MRTAAPSLLASNVAFVVVFSVFVVALVALIVVTLVWVVRRDKAGRAAWRRRQLGEPDPAEGDTAP